jgi:HTH-type transcriptional regulator/antitoxin HipB
MILKVLRVIPSYALLSIMTIYVIYGIVLFYADMRIAIGHFREASTMIDRARTPQQIGQALRAARREKGLSQTELASLSGQRQELISKIESGSPGTSISAIFALLAALGLELVLRPRFGAAPDIEDVF